MAISGGDGSIILTTKVDTSGITKGFDDMKKPLDDVDKKTKKTTKSTKDYGEQARKSTTKAQEGFESLETTLSGVASALAATFAVSKLIQFSNESGNVATQTEASVQRLVDIYGSASDSVGDFIDSNARALGMSKAAAASFSSVYGNLFSVWADQQTNAVLTTQYLQMTAVVASKTGRTVEDVQERIRSGLLGNTEAIEDLGIFVNVKTIEMTDAFQRMADGRSWEQLDAYTQQQIRSMAILEQATSKYGDEVENTTATIRNRYRAAYEDFKNSWGQIVNTVLIPVLSVLTQIFDVATRGLNAIFGSSDSILENEQRQETLTGEVAKNVFSQVKNQKKFNAEVKKGVASFDELTTLSSSGTPETEPAETPNLAGGLQNNLDFASIQKEVSKALTRLMRIIGASLMAIGVFLLFNKQIKWGVGFIIAGAMAFGVSAASGISSAGDFGIGALLTEIMGLIGDALLAVGLVLLVTGSVSWAIGFIVAGAALMGIEYFAVTEFSTDPIANTLIKVLGIAGLAVAAIGIILCVFGGATALPWGIGLILGGAAMLGSAAALNSEAIVEAIRGPLGAIMAVVGASLLVVGIIMCATGVGLPFGVALILAGATGLVTPIALNANVIVDWVKGVWNAVKAFWNRHIAPVFTLKWWGNLAVDCGNGLIAGFEGAINGIIWLFETMINWVVKGLNKLSFTVPDWVPGIGGSKFGFNIPKADLGRVYFGRIPYLAQGAVIPGGREFLAVLGDQPKGQTNIEAPLATIKQAVAEVLGEVGNGNNQPIVIEIDGREVFRAVRNAESRYGSQTIIGGVANAY